MRHDFHLRRVGPVHCAFPVAISIESRLQAEKLKSKLAQAEAGQTLTMKLVETLKSAQNDLRTAHGQVAQRFVRLDSLRRVLPRFSTPHWAYRLLLETSHFARVHQVYPRDCQL